MAVVRIAAREARLRRKVREHLRELGYTRGPGGILVPPSLNKASYRSLHLSQRDLGELAGMTRQRTNSAIKTLEKLGVLSVRYGGLLMKDFSALQRCSSEKMPG